MADNKNVIIPLPLMDKIIELLGYWDVSKYDPVIQLELLEVLRYLEIKKRKLRLRDHYAKVILADNQDKRDDARIRYLKEKTWLRDDSADLTY